MSKQVKVEDLKEGDMVDLELHPWFADDEESKYMYGIVLEVTPEANGIVVAFESFDECLFPVGTLLTVVDPHENF